MPPFFTANTVPAILALADGTVKIEAFAREPGPRDRAVRAMILRQTDRPLVVPARCRIEPGLIGAAEAGYAAFS